MSEEGKNKSSITTMADVLVDQTNAGFCSIAGCQLPREIFVDLEDGDRELVFAKGWRIETNLTGLEGERGLYYPISSTNPAEDRRFFMPSSLIDSVRLK